MKKVVLQKNAHKQYLQMQQKRRNNVRTLEYLKIGISGGFLTLVLLAYGLIVNKSSTIGYQQRQLALEQQNLQHKQTLTKLHILDTDSQLLSQVTSQLNITDLAAAKKVKVVKSNVYVVQLEKQLAYKQ